MILSAIFIWLSFSSIIHEGLDFEENYLAPTLLGVDQNLLFSTLLSAPNKVPNSQFILSSTHITDSSPSIPRRTTNPMNFVCQKMDSVVKQMRLDENRVRNSALSMDWTTN